MPFLRVWCSGNMRAFQALVTSSILVTRLSSLFFMKSLSEYEFGGLERHPCNILRLISELEGSYQLCKFMGFEEDMKILDEMKKPYYKLYFKTKKEEKFKGD